MKISGNSICGVWRSVSFRKISLVTICLGDYTTVKTLLVLSTHCQQKQSTEVATWQGRPGGRGWPGVHRQSVAEFPPRYGSRSAMLVALAGMGRLLQLSLLQHLNHLVLVAKVQ